RGIQKPHDERAKPAAVKIESRLRDEAVTRRGVGNTGTGGDPLIGERLGACGAVNVLEGISPRAGVVLGKCSAEQRIPAADAAKDRRAAFEAGIEQEIGAENGG